MPSRRDRRTGRRGRRGRARSRRGRARRRRGCRGRARTPAAALAAAALAAAALAAAAWLLWLRLPPWPWRPKALAFALASILAALAAFPWPGPLERTQRTPTEGPWPAGFPGHRLREQGPLLQRPHADDVPLQRCDPGGVAFGRGLRLPALQPVQPLLEASPDRASLMQPPPGPGAVAASRLVRAPCARSPRSGNGRRSGRRTRLTGQASPWTPKSHRRRPPRSKASRERWRGGFVTIMSWCSSAGASASAPPELAALLTQPYRPDPGKATARRHLQSHSAVASDFQFALIYRLQPDILGRPSVHYRL